ncbi:MAG: hypothetical protein ABIB79_01830 [archaeon]
MEYLEDMARGFRKGWEETKLDLKKAIKFPIKVHQELEKDIWGYSMGVQGLGAALMMMGISDFVNNEIRIFSALSGISFVSYAGLMKNAARQNY